MTRRRRRAAALGALLSVASSPSPRARAEPEPSAVAIVAAVADPNDEAPVYALAAALRGALSKRRVPVAAAAFSPALERTQGGEDPLGQALMLAGETPLLRYALYEEAVAHSHVRAILQLVQRERAVLVAAPIAGRFHLRRVSLTEPGRALDVSSPCEERCIEEAAERLFPEGALASASEPPPKASSAPLRRRWLFMTAATTAGAALVTTGVLLAHRNARGERFAESSPREPHYLDRADDWRALRPPMLVAATTTALLASGLAATAGLRLPRAHWLIPVVGAAALGAVAWGSVERVLGDRCPRAPESPAACAEGERRLDRGTLLLLASAPLLSFASAGALSWTLRPGPHGATALVTFHNTL